MPPGFTLKMVEETRVGPNLRPLKRDAVGDVGGLLWLLLGTVGIVLLIACANVANLFLVRAEGRQRELAIRAAMGASWRQVAQELLFESLTLGVLGGLFGLLLAAGVALLLGMVGIYGVISYTVAQRTREIGIRIALGAQQSEVRGMFVRHGLVLACVGIMLGLGAALGLTRLMSSLLFGVSSLDPVTFFAVALILGGVAFLATYLPARRASIVDPVEALRWE